MFSLRLISWLLAGACAPVAAGILHVDSSAHGNADGTSWSDAYPDLQDALAAAVSGDEIWVAAGVYYPDEGASQTDGDRSATFQLIDGVAVFGGFVGIESALSEREPGTFVTVLSGDIGQDDADATPDFITDTPSAINGSNSIVVVTASSNATTAVLDGFTITGGNANSGITTGGGLYATGGSPTVRRCTFRGNRANGRGGGIFLNGGSANFENCLIVANHAVERGGGIGLIAASPTFTNCVIQGNLAKRGGGCNFNNSTAAMVNCSVSGNSGTINGGAMQGAVNSVTTLTNCIFWNNLAAGSSTGTKASINNISGASYSQQNSILHNITGSDPGFYTASDPSTAPNATGDLRLRTNSSAIDTGIGGVNTATRDLADRLREIGTIDPGAYETPNVVHVDRSATGSGDGSGWADAYTDLATALENASDGDALWVAGGVYYPDESAGGADLTSRSFQLIADIAVLGGFAGTETAAADRLPEVNVTVLSGDITQNDTDPDGDGITEDSDDLVGPNSIRVVSGGERTTLLDGFTVSGGADDAGFFSDTRVSNCRLVGNQTGGDGDLGRGDHFVECVFESNGAINGRNLVSYGGVTYQRCLIEGGIRATEGATAVIDCRGGTLFVEDPGSLLKVVNSNFDVIINEFADLQLVSVTVDELVNNGGERVFPAAWFPAHIDAVNTVVHGSLTELHTVDSLGFISTKNPVKLRFSTSLTAT